jgi:hypothetical protein
MEYAAGTESLARDMHNVRIADYLVRRLTPKGP